MKKAILFLTAIMSVASAKANNFQEAYNEAAAREQRIKEALEVLINEGVVSESENQCLKVDQSLLNQLKSDGTVVPSHGPTPQSVCITK